MDQNGSLNIEETTSLLGSTNSTSKENKIGFFSWFFCCRNVLLFLQFWGFVTVYGMRANLSVALVAMVNQTFAEESGDKVYIPECREFHGNSTSEDKKAEDGPFKWDQQTQGYILSAFFYGYIVTQIPGGWLAQRYGGKKVLGYGIFISALFTVLTPIAARTHLLFLIAVRVLAGFGEGVTFPAATLVWSRWATPHERSSYLVFSFAGDDSGAILSLAVTGWLSSLPFDGGWPLTFYAFGALGFLWFISWMILVYESPSQHPRIALWEKQYILKGIGNSQDTNTKKKTVPTPWKSILTSPPLWALTVTMFSWSWGWYIFLTCLPSYFEEVLDFNIQQNGVLAALPFIASLTIKSISVRLSDHLMKKGYGCTFLRKAFSTLAFIIASSLLLPVGFVKCSQTVLSIVLLTISCGALGLYSPTNCANPVDLSPRFSGIVMSICNFGANFPGFLLPLVVGSLTNHQPTRGQWKKVFYITCGLYLSGLLIFLIFGSGKEQPWNSPPHVETDDDDDDDIASINVARKESCDGSHYENSFEKSARNSYSSVV